MARLWGLCMSDRRSDDGDAIEARLWGRCMSDRRLVPDYPGSRWWKFDFHTHTPASTDWRGDDSGEKITARDWLDHVKPAGLDCVAVTDHNSARWIDALKKAQLDFLGLADITIFPGVEITVGESSGRVHLLAIFDPSWDGEKISAVLGQCGITSGFGDAETTTTTKSFIETVEIIEKAGGLAIAAHIDRNKGLLWEQKTLTPQLKKSLASLSAAEFCVLNAFDSESTEYALRSAIAKIPKVAGSDAHELAKIGQHFSWIKMGKPSIEGLSLALSDHEFCVKNQTEDPNHTPDMYLSKLTIRNMKYCGRLSDFQMGLNPHFNAVIGGRGSGKSTVLESLRIVLRRDQDLEALSETSRRLTKFKGDEAASGVILPNTEILLELNRRESLYRLRWASSAEGPVLEKRGPDGWEFVGDDSLKDRFPVRVLSQKQIDELSSNPRGLLQILDDSDEVNYSEWKDRWAATVRDFSQLMSQARDLKSKLSEEGSLRTQLEDIENDLKVYEEKGHGDILKRYQVCMQQENGLPGNQIFDDLASDIKKIIANAEVPDFPAHLFSDNRVVGSSAVQMRDALKELTTIHEDSASALQAERDAMAACALNIEALKLEKIKRIEATQWFQSVRASEHDYNQLIKEYEEKKSPLRLALYEEWVQKRNRLQQKLNQLVSVRSSLETTEASCLEKYGELRKLRAELLEKRKEFIQKVIGDNPLVRMDVLPYGDLSTIERDYREVLDLGESGFSGAILDENASGGILWPLFDLKRQQKKADIWDCIEEIKSKTEEVAKGEDTQYHGAFNNRLTKLWTEKPEYFDRFWTWFPEDRLQVRYSQEAGSRKFENLENGSAGQKAAAILAFLLSYGDEPLIIDQPEDDLDNALIYELIVKQIHENKNRRQIIIVTHNPNIVVNGDAELVHVLKFEKGQIQLATTGGLEETELRDAVCTIMEGGRVAFDKRYKRIRRVSDV